MVYSLLDLSAAFDTTDYDILIIRLSSWSGIHGRAVLTNGHTGHVPRAPGFFLFEGPPTGCGEINF